MTQTVRYASVTTESESHRTLRHLPPAAGLLQTHSSSRLQVSLRSRNAYAGIANARYSNDAATSAVKPATTCGSELYGRRIGTMASTTSRVSLLIPGFKSDWTGQKFSPFGKFTS